jgi:hypothetical protein
MTGLDDPAGVECAVRQPWVVSGDADPGLSGTGVPRRDVGPRSRRCDAERPGHARPGGVRLRQIDRPRLLGHPGAADAVARPGANLSRTPTVGPAGASARSPAEMVKARRRPWWPSLPEGPTTPFRSRARRYRLFGSRSKPAFGSSRRPAAPAHRWDGTTSIARDLSYGLCYESTLRQGHSALVVSRSPSKVDPC